MTDTFDRSQRRPSLDILDEVAPDEWLESPNRSDPPGFLRLKIPIWEKEKGRMGASTSGGSHRRSKRSQDSSKKGSRWQGPKSKTRHDETMDDDVSPTNSVPGTPRLVSPDSVSTLQTPLSSEIPPETPPGDESKSTNPDRRQIKGAHFESHVEVGEALPPVDGEKGQKAQAVSPTHH